MTVVELTPDEVRWLQAKRAQEAVTEQPGPSPISPTITQGEWELLQLHRVAKQAPLVGSGIASNTRDPLQEQHAVAIVVLRSIREEVCSVERGSQMLLDVLPVLDRWLGILSADGKDGPQSPGLGR